MTRGAIIAIVCEILSSCSTAPKVSVSDVTFCIYDALVRQPGILDISVDGPTVEYEYARSAFPMPIDTKARLTITSVSNAGYEVAGSSVLSPGDPLKSHWNDVGSCWIKGFEYQTDDSHEP